MRTPVLTQINRALEFAGRDERLVRGRGYYYLRDGIAHTLRASGIYGFEPELSGVDSSLRAVENLFAENGITTIKLARLWAAGDLVETWFDTGGGKNGGPQILYGEVVEAGPSAVKIRWESGLTNRVEQLREGIKLARDQALARESIEARRIL